MASRRSRAKPPPVEEDEDIVAVRNAPMAYVVIEGVRREILGVYADELEARQRARQSTYMTVVVAAAPFHAKRR